MAHWQCEQLLVKTDRYGLSRRVQPYAEGVFVKAPVFSFKLKMLILLLDLK